MSCSDNDDSLPEIISKDDAGQLGYTVQCPDTLFFHNLGESQTLNVTIRDANNNVLDASAIKYAPLGIGFTVSDNQITVNEKVLEKPVQTMTFNCELPNTTLRDEIVIVFTADTSRNTKESRTIYVKEPGTLSSLIVEEDYKQIKKLTLYGQLNTKDQIFLRKLLGGEETIAKFDLIDYEGGFGYMIPYESNRLYFNHFKELFILFDGTVVNQYIKIFENVFSEMMDLIFGFASELFCIIEIIYLFQTVFIFINHKYI